MERNMHVSYKWLLCFAFAFGPLTAVAQNVNGVLRVVKGNVQIKSAKTGQTTRARIGAKVFPKDIIITAKDSRAKIVMVDNNEINVSPDSQIEIQNYEYDPAAGKKDVLLNVIYGKVRSKVEQKYDGKTSKFQIKTPSAVAGVRGTDFLTSFNQSNGQSQVVTFEGAVQFGAPGPGGAIVDPVMVTPGTMASIALGQTATPPVPMPKEQLAKMDAETKADTASGSTDSNSRNPANGNDNGKKDEGKKDGAKNDGAKVDGNKGNDKNANGKENSANGKDNAKGSASNNGKGGGGGNAPQAGAPAARAPGSVPPPTGSNAPASGVGAPMPGTMLTDSDFAGSPGSDLVLAPPDATQPIFVPPIIDPALNPITECTTCTSLIENSSTKLTIQINTGP